MGMAYLLAMASNPDTNLISVNSCCSKQIINSTGKRQKYEAHIMSFNALEILSKKRGSIRIIPKDDQGHVILSNNSVPNKPKANVY